MQRLLLLVLFPLGLLLPLGGLAHGAGMPATADAPTSSAEAAKGPHAPAEVRAFLAPLLAEAMATHHIPGLAAVVVHRGEILFCEGLGQANVEQEVAVDPELTVFPLGSISKLVTSLAVLQQVDAGKLDLDADIARYLQPGRQPSTAEPVTLRHLLTHTDGFDVRWLFGGATTTPATLPSLAQLLQPLPERILPPGEMYLYSDVGLTLAGRLVEIASGEDFPTYMERNVLGPLDMTRSSFARPLPPDLLGHRATGYEDTYDGQGTNRPVPVVYPLAGPASALAATPRDVANLMIAQLQGGRWANRQILAPDMITLLTTRQFSHHPEIPGTCFGYYEYFHHDERAVLHGGLMLGFTSVLLLLPEHEVGLFVVANKYGLVELLEAELVQRFLDHYYPATPPAETRPVRTSPLQAAAAAHPAANYAGRYRSDQYSRLSTDKIALASGEASELVVTQPSPGNLRFEPWGTDWREIGPALFECVSTGERVLFRLRPDGTAERILGSAQFMSYHRVSWFDRLRTQALMAGGYFVLMLGGTLALPALWLARRREPAGAATWSWRTLALLTSLLSIAFFVLLYWAMQHIDVTTAFLGQPPLMRRALQLPPVFALTGGATLVLGLLLVRRAALPATERGALLLVGVAAVLFVPVLLYWNLL